MDTANPQALAAFLAQHFSHGDTYESAQILKTLLGEQGSTLTVYALDNSQGQVTVCEADGARWWILEWSAEPEEPEPQA